MSLRSAWPSLFLFMSFAASLSSHLRLVWHRRDLRLHDNAVYENLSEKGMEVVSVFIFDDRDFQPRASTALPHQWNAVNIGPHAGRILVESLLDLRESLQKIGGELLVRRGNPARIIPQLIAELGASEVYWSEELGHYEGEKSNDVWQSVRKSFPHVKIQTSMQYTLYHPDDLPSGEAEWQNYVQPNRKKSKRKQAKRQLESPPPSFQWRNGRRLSYNDNLVEISTGRWNGMPRIMGDFRKAARAKTKPRSCIPAPLQLSTPPNLPNKGELPSLADLYSKLGNTSKPILGLPSDVIDEVLINAQKNHSQKEKLHVLRGGERAALSHLADFCANHAASATRNSACVDDNESSHLSHFLAFGCLSPRKIIEEAEACGESCNWIISHMTMRDFFLFTCLASGSQFYQLKGIPVSKKGSDKIVWNDWREESTKQNWAKWAMGETRLPLVDATMKELHATGYCSNRVRQNVASLLTKDLGIDWRAGAELFQFLLADHCVGANWGNWLYFSGVGPDPKQRHFRTISQALKYDREGTFVYKWLPKLRDIDGDEAFLRPWDFSEAWGQPIVLPESQYVWQDSQRLQAKNSLLAEEE